MADLAGSASRTVAAIMLAMLIAAFVEGLRADSVTSQPFQITPLSIPSQSSPGIAASQPSR